MNQHPPDAPDLVDLLIGLFMGFALLFIVRALLEFGSHG